MLTRINLSPGLHAFFWVSVGLGIIAFIGLVAGGMLLLGTMAHRKIGLPVVWISASVLAACGTCVVLLLSQ